MVWASARLRFEKSTVNGQQSTVKHIFMGANRIATTSLRGGGTAADEAISYYHSDHLGSSNVISNQAGNLIQNCEYLPYGQFSTNTGIKSTSYYFTGKELDDETGLMFYGARYYDPQIGRFITPDAIVSHPYDLQDLNRYSYCNNNPINYIDPTGHKGLGDWFKDIFKSIGDSISSVAKAIMSGDWKTIAIVVISIAANVLLPGSGTLASNFFMNVALHAIRGAAIGALTGGISSSIMGGSFWQGVKAGAISGAIAGAIQGVTSSEQFQNWKSGNGFKSDDVVQAEQLKAANSKVTLPQAKGSDVSMRSALRQQNPGENIDLGKIVVTGNDQAKTGLAVNTKAFLENLSKYSAIASAACAFAVPGFPPAILGTAVFGMISASAALLEVSLFSVAPIAETGIIGIQTAVGEGAGGYSIFTDEIIEIISKANNGDQ